MERRGGCCDIVAMEAKFIQESMDVSWQDYTSRQEGVRGANQAQL